MVSKREVARCGELLAGGPCADEERDRATAVLEMWRAAHQRPMEQVELAVRSASGDIGGALCASRLKRRDTILGKLRRPNTHYTLRDLDDIAGCRCIVPSVDDVQTVAGRLRSEATYEKSKDYIAAPKPSGYRSTHLFHRCDSPGFGYERLRVEVQVRTTCQHAWATAVETYDMLNSSKLKFGFGGAGQTRAFALLSNLIAFHERCPGVPGAPSTPSETRREFSALEDGLRIIPVLGGFCKCVTAMENGIVPSDAGYYLLELSCAEQFVQVTPYPEGGGEEAQSDYSQKERAKAPESDVLLVKADSIEGLKAAYPNYFSDISSFLELMDELL